MSSSTRPVDSLQPGDLVTHPVWEFASNDEPDETNVHPVAELPTDSLENRIAGAEVELANGSRVWAVVGNVDVNDARRTRHFLTLSVFTRDEWFHLARYHDVGREQRGPTQLAQALGLSLDEVFPIRYNTYTEVLAFGEPIIVCDFCLVDFASYDPAFFNRPPRTKLGLGAFVEVRPITNPSRGKDKFCPVCRRRLAFLRFLAKVRETWSSSIEGAS